MAGLEIEHLTNQVDERGDSYYISHETVDFLGFVDEIHFSTINPGKVRGNHYHEKRSEVIILFFSDSWRLAWIPIDSEESVIRDFSGGGAVIVKVSPGVRHAFKNTGASVLRAVSYSNGRFNPANPDTFRTVLLMDD